VSVVVVTESSHELEQTRAQLRDEQQSRKQLQTQLSELSETSAELAAAKHAADTVYLSLHTIRHEALCFNMQSKADMSQINLPHGTNNQIVENRKTKN